MKYWIVKDNGQYHRIGLTSKPIGYDDVYECPEGAEHGSEVKIIDNTAVLDIDAKDKRLAQEFTNKNANRYKDRRRDEYPSIADQLDALYKKHHLGIDTEYANICNKIEAIKNKYPKPQS